MSTDLPPRSRSPRSPSPRRRDRGKLARCMAIEALEDRLMLADDLASHIPLLWVAPVTSPAARGGDAVDPGGLAGHRPLHAREGQPLYDAVVDRAGGGHRGLLPADPAIGRSGPEARGTSRPR